MALIADLVQPFPDFLAVDRISVVSQAFPVPKEVRGYMTNVEDAWVLPQGVGPSYIVAGALVAESPYLEPTTGQIWPR